MSINDIVFYFYTVAYLWEIDIPTVINITLSLNTIYLKSTLETYEISFTIFSLLSLSTKSLDRKNGIIILNWKM